MTHITAGRFRLEGGIGEWRDGNTRYLMIRDDSLMGLFRRLPLTARRAALAALTESVAEAGGASLARYLAANNDGDEALLHQVGAVAAQLGWGVWTFEWPSPDELRLSVANSPFASGFGESSTPVCAPIAGMLEALASILIGEPASAREISCAAVGDGPCRFVARRQNP